MSRLIIEASTPLCLLQDAGRFGVRHLGVTQGGALDWVSMAWANWLLDNALDAPVVEITLGGLTVQAEDYCLLALAGADLGAYVDERAISPGRSFILQKGQRLRFTQPFNGARAYLAAPGGFDAQAVLGSCATVVREALGGVDGFGKALAEGGRLAYSGTGGAMKVLAKPELQSGASLGRDHRRADRPVQRAEPVRCVQHRMGSGQPYRPHGHAFARYAVAIPGAVVDFRRDSIGRDPGATGWAADCVAQ